MDIEKEYSCLEQNKKVFTKIIEVDESYQETLQAYCDDMYRIIKCTAHSHITNVDTNTNEIKIFGRSEICITYYDESSNLCYADFDEEFSRSVEAENLSDTAFAYVKACDKYCSFRVINQRRIDIHSSCSLNVSVYDKHSSPCISSCKSSKLKCENIITADVVGSSISKAEFDEEILFPTNVKRVVSATGFVTLDEIKIIKDKALIKFNVCLSILYCIDNGNEKIERFEHSFSASKIIDVNNIDENSVPIISLDIGSLYFKIKNSSNDNNSVVQIYGDVVANCLFIVESEKKLITDGYVLKHKSKCDYSSVPCMCGGKKVFEQMQSNITFEFNSEIKEIYDFCVTAYNVSIKNGKITAVASAIVVCKTENDDLTSLSTTAEFEVMNTSYSNGICSIITNSFDYSIRSNGKIEVRYSFTVCGYLCEEKSISILSELTADDEQAETPALTVYFAKKDEMVWNIAKKFSSDTDLIMTENSLESDVIPSNSVLIIPSL